MQTAMQDPATIQSGFDCLTCAMFWLWLSYLLALTVLPSGVDCHTCANLALTVLAVACSQDPEIQTAMQDPATMQQIMVTSGGHVRRRVLD